MNLVGNFGDDNRPLPTPEVLDLPAGADAKAAASRRISLANAALVGDQQTAGRKVRPLDVLKQLVWLGLGILDQMLAGLTEFVGVVGRNGRCHADGNA